MTYRYPSRPATQRSDTSSRLRRLGSTLLLSLGLSLGAQAQQAPQFFRPDGEAQGAAAASPLSAALYHSQALTLDVSGLRAALATAPAETQVGAAPLVLALPLPNGGTGRFAIHEAPVMEPALAARHPDIKTYAGVGLDDKSASVRLDLTPQGFHGQVLAAGGQSFYIDPVTRTDTRHYLAFYQKDMNRAAAGKVPTCDFAPTKAELAASDTRVAAAASRSTSALSSGPQLRTYRLALANTPEYAVARGNTTASVTSAKVTTVNRVVGVYEKELAVRLVLIANNDLITFLSGSGPQPPTTYSNANGSAMLTQNQTNVDALIGNANYDIGHVVSTGGGGVAYLGVVCGARKAGGVTGSPSPVGDAFDIDYVAHEMGHQFSGNHTFNNNSAGSCQGNRNTTTAFEPGSGTTIMAYAGICGSANDLQPHSDPTFHTGNYQEMRAFIDGTSCSVNSATGNTAPVVTPPASGKVLPISTPFKLTATATDAENDALTYMWEEMDLGAAGTPNDAQAAGQTFPLFRSFVPLTSSTRYFPRLNDLVNNTTVIGERLPTVTRPLSFRCTVRDEHSGPVGVIGGVNYSSTVTLNTTSAAGPFVVQYPNTAVSWIGGAAQTVTWDVANTVAAPVSCATVNILLSLDGGLTYPTVLATNVPNNGSAVVVAPSPATAQTQARIMVEAADNYFFDISNTNFTITPAAVGPTITSFTPTGGLPGTVVTVLGSNFTGATAVAFNGTAAASFTVVSATQLTATVAAGTTTGTITITTPLGTATSAMPFIVGAPPTITSFSPTSGAVGGTVIITGTNFTGATQVTFNGTIAPTFTVNSATQITVTVPAGATTGFIGLTAPTGTATSTTVFTVIPAPTITSFTPSFGRPGTVVTITGTNFTGVTAVLFNGVTAPTFTVNSATEITVTVPAGATTGFISVTGPGGTATSTTVFTVPVLANDLCTDAIPVNCGQTVNGTTVGATNVTDPTGSCSAVTVDGGGVFYSIVGTGRAITVSTCATATSFDTKLFVYRGACGSFICVAANDDVTCAARQFASAVTFNSTLGTTYYIMVSGYGTATVPVATGAFALSISCVPPAPVITSLSPVSGPVGTTVTVTGTDFTGATGVTLNGQNVNNLVVVNATTITFTVPASASTGNVVVTTPGGASNGTLFTVVPPAITSMSPASGPVGTTVTLTGTGLSGVTSLTLNGVAITNFTVVNGTTITFTIPAGATSGNVVLTSPAGASAGSAFTVTVVSATTNAAKSEFSVWPNPVAGKGALHVKLAVPAASATLTLYNVLGQAVSTRSFGGSGTEVPTAGLASGTYLLSVQTPGHAPSIQRVVVE
ncbi:IPT/TIG domain-containing protein [Hymenobacter properus]|uniref:IPT/TIG domain-containing protein n=1 Tax=Hymenobacter properus TaxID=2791026 RepID=A0A931FIU1_9BACT|nr:IPT/TIG domain-containing protein [Hymenobacter properus]MBF9142347.1 IPT/TIG domain-containing protein [Hymenobacter properus]MBR7721154.1 IPT/TIG domain-containing protein [Microvirga sp. SRT04]